jgi:nucleoside-diphosphate-sugar epimerase
MHLVTGSSGFLGSAIVKKLVKLGEKVRAIDILEDDEVSKISEFEKIDISILKNLEKSKIFDEVKYVHHNAAKVPLTKAGSDFYSSNVTGTINILEQCKKHSVNHISHMSSSAIFGKPAKDYNVNYNSYSPTGYYGKTKYLAELEVLKYQKSNLIKNSSIIRPRPVIGEGRLGIFQILFDWVKDNKKIPIIGDANNIFQFANIDDLVDVSIETALKQKKGIFNIGNEEYSTLKNDLNTSFKKIGSRSTVLPINEKLAIAALFTLDKLNLSPLSSWHYLSYSWNFYYDQKVNFERLEWRPKKSNVDLIIQAYNWYIQQEKNLTNNSSPHRNKIKQKMLNVVKIFM